MTYYTVNNFFNWKNGIYRVLILLLFFCSVRLANAQTVAPTFRNLSIKDGLVGDNVLCINQDSKGFIWIGTFAGLHRYDGYDFKVFNRNVPPHHPYNLIADNTIYCIEEDSHKDLWFGTERGLSHYDPELDSFTNYYPNKIHPELGPSHENVRCIYEDEDGYIWLGTYGGGINCFDPKTKEFRHFRNDKGAPLPCEKINDFYVDKDGRFWIGTEDCGLVKFDRTNETFKEFMPDNEDPYAITDDVVNDIIEDKYGKLWVATWGGGVCEFDPFTERFHAYKYSNNKKGTLRNGIVRSVLEDSNGKIWAATFGGGLSLFDRETHSFSTFLTNSENPLSISNNLLWALFEDSNGLLWIGTSGAGVNILNPTREGFSHYEINSGARSLVNNQISSVCEMDNGEVWLGTVEGGIQILDRETGKTKLFDRLKEDPPTTIRKIYQDRHKDIWIGTDEGLYYYKRSNGKLMYYRHKATNPYSLDAKGVYAIAEDSHGTIWVGTWETGLNRLDSNEYAKENPEAAQFKHYRHSMSDSSTISSDKIWDIYIDKNDDLWIGTEKSLDKYDPETEEFYHYGAMNASKIIADPAGTFWVGTYGQGIMKFNPRTNKIKFYNQLANVDINLVLDMVPDKDNNLWLCSIDGITKFNLKTEEFVNIDLTYELKKNEYAINVINVLHDGKFLLGGDFGVDIFDPEKIKLQETVPEVVFTDFQIFNKTVSIHSLAGKEMLGKAISYTDQVKLTYEASLFSIEFSALYYSSQDRHHYAYKLDGFDSEWHYAHADSRKATYMNLDPGEYTFRVKAATREGNWSKDKLLKINISPPFWNTLLFKVAVALLLLGSLAYFYKRRLSSERSEVVRQYNADKLMQEQEIIKLKNEKLDAELEHKKKELASSTLHNMHKSEELSNVSDSLKAVEKELKGSPYEKKIKKIIDQIDQNIENNDNWEYFEKNFNLLHEDFLKRFMEAYPRLTHKDLKICAFIRMNFDNKEIARMLNITPESLGVSRTRIRKKINLDKGTYLNDFVMRF